LVIDEAIRFLSHTPPFQFLDERLIRSVAGSLSIEYYPKGTVILRQDGPVSDSLRLVKKGGVKIILKPKGGGDDVVVDYRGPGETFGLVSLMGNRQKTTITSVDDTICYLLPKERLNELMASNPAITEYLLQFHLTKYADTTSREIQGKSFFVGSGDHVLFATRVGEIAVRVPPTVEPGATIREAARRMIEGRQSAILVVEGNGAPVGIVTDSDLRTKVVAAAHPVDSPVRTVMTTPVFTVDADDHCLEAILKMLRHNVHHVAVTKDGLVMGLLSDHDFMLLQGKSPLAYSEDIEQQTTIEGLAPVSAKVLGIIGFLLREGARATNIVRIISELNDRILCKVLEIAERDLGPAPVPYCWLALGSEGRKEQTFRTDQDNAIIYEDCATPEQESAARDYFSRFAAVVRDGLVKCGFHACPANYMASNPEWCQPLENWKRYFSRWVSQPSPEAVLNSLIFFDFRPIRGDEMLARRLRDHLVAEVPEFQSFLGFLANMIVKNRPPIGFFGSVVVERSGEHKDELNLKIKGIAPIVDIARLFSLEKGIRHSSTLDRLKSLRASHTLMAEYADELEYAFEFIMLLRIHHQYRQMEAGEDIDNFVNLEELSNLEKQTLKNTFRLILKVQEMVMDRYQSFIL
jgi:CBS domain-containing protein